MTERNAMSSISVSYAGTTKSARSNELGMRPMQERAWEKRGEQYLLIKSPPASGKSRAVMFVALDKLANQGIRQAIVVVPERTIGASFNDEPPEHVRILDRLDRATEMELVQRTGHRRRQGQFREHVLKSDDQVLVCTHATFRFAIERFGADAFDNRLIAVDEFHHVSPNPDNKLGDHVGQLMARDKAHIVAMTGSYFRGDAEPVLGPR